MRGTFRSRRPSSACAVALCALCFVLSPPSAREARACPAPSFSEYVEYSDLIVVGKVVSVEREKVVSGEDSWETAVATVKVESVLRGAVDVTKPLLVADLVDDEEAAADAPAPTDAKTLLVVASWDEDRGRFASEITRDVTRDDAREAYTSSVRDLLPAVALAEDDEERYRRGTEWAVRSIESEFTRDDALRDLDRFSRYWKDDETLVDMLDASQRERLVEVMLSAKAPDATFGYEIAGTLARYRDGRVLGYLQEALERERRAEPSTTAGWLMSMIAEQMEWQTGQWLAGQYPYDGAATDRRKAIARFTKLMRTRKELPEVLEAQAARAAQEDSVGAEVTDEREQAIREAEERFEFAPEEEESTTEDTVNTENP